MTCIKVDIPEEICAIDDEPKAIYHSKNTVCIWVFKISRRAQRLHESNSWHAKG